MRLEFDQILRKYNLLSILITDSLYAFKIIDLNCGATLKLSELLCTISLIEQSRDVAQFGSAPVLGTGGRRFESCHPENALSSVGRT